MTWRVLHAHFGGLQAMNRCLDDSEVLGETKLPRIEFLGCNNGCWLRDDVRRITLWRGSCLGHINACCSFCAGLSSGHQHIHFTASAAS